MKSPNLPTKPQSIPTGIPSGVPQETGKNTPTLDEIYRRARQIHLERGGHVCGFDNYLDEWWQAERELQRGSTKSSGE